MSGVFFFFKLEAGCVLLFLFALKASSYCDWYFMLTMWRRFVSVVHPVQGNVRPTGHSLPTPWPTEKSSSSSRKHCTTQPQTHKRRGPVFVWRLITQSLSYFVLKNFSMLCQNIFARRGDPCRILWLDVINMTNEFKWPKTRSCAQLCTSELV